MFEAPSCVREDKAPKVIELGETVISPPATVNASSDNKSFHSNVIKTFSFTPYGTASPLGIALLVPTPAAVIATSGSEISTVKVNASAISTKLPALSVSFIRSA